MGCRPVSRSERIVRRLHAHVLLSPTGHRSARERLEAELGPELTRRLVQALAPARGR